jgi:hypothetical protein
MQQTACHQRWRCLVVLVVGVVSGAQSSGVWGPCHTHCWVPPGQQP